MPQIKFKSAPDQEDKYRVGDRVETYCDHEIGDERFRDWLPGVVVQVDPKLVAVQFQEKVYLTDGWMIPDYVLWIPPDSKKIRLARKRRKNSTRRALKK